MLSAVRFVKFLVMFSARGSSREDRELYARILTTKYPRVVVSAC